MDWSVATNLFLLLSAPFVGSFLNVLAERWPKGEHFVRGRSRCETCGHILGWRDLIPILSWTIARGRCRYCGAWISIRHPIVELAAAAIAVWSLAELPARVSWISTMFGWALLALAIIDFRWLWLPSALTLPLGLAGLLTTWIVRPSDTLDHLLGAVLGYTILGTIAWVYRRYRGREGLGHADPVLFGTLGAWVGWQGLATVLLYAGIGGLISLLIQARAGRTIQLTTRVPFGPYLCLGGWLVWLYGPLYFE
jgi:leader peptidase (prepilin peptidase) / N-methyltransferase